MAVVTTVVDDDSATPTAIATSITKASASAAADNRPAVQKWFTTQRIIIVSAVGGAALIIISIIWVLCHRERKQGRLLLAAYENPERKPYETITITPPSGKKGGISSEALAVEKLPPPSANPAPQAPSPLSPQPQYFDLYSPDSPAFQMTAQTPAGPLDNNNKGGIISGSYFPQTPQPQYTNQYPADQQHQYEPQQHDSHQQYEFHQRYESQQYQYPGPQSPYGEAMEDAQYNYVEQHYVEYDVYGKEIGYASSNGNPVEHSPDDIYSSYASTPYEPPRAPENVYARRRSLASPLYIVTPPQNDPVQRNIMSPGTPRIISPPVTPRSVHTPGHGPMYLPHDFPNSSPQAPPPPSPPRPPRGPEVYLPTEMSDGMHAM